LEVFFSFSGFFEKERGLFIFAGACGANPRRIRLAISPAPGAIQQQPEPLGSAGRHKIQEMQTVHAIQTYFDRIGMNGKTNATK